MKGTMCRVVKEGSGAKKGGGVGDCPHCGMGKREFMVNIRILNADPVRYECKNCGCQWEIGLRRFEE